MSPWRIGPVTIPSRIVLAPMAGVSVQAFRRQGRRYGAGLVCSEMVSCAGLHHGNERTLGYLRIATDEHPLAVQIFGSDPPVMAEAARMVADAGADIVDINFGCPVKKVTKTGAGATLLDDPKFQPNILEPLEVYGIDSWKPGEVTIKARIKTVPLKQWEVGRELRKRIRKRFEAEGIEIPFPERVVTVRTSDTGTATKNAAASG